METLRRQIRRAAVSPRKAQRSSAAIRDDHQVYRSIFSNAAIGIALTDAEGRLLQVNQTWLSMLNYERHEVLGRPPSHFTHAEDLEKSNEKLAALMAGRVDRYRLEKRYLRKDGSSCWVDLSVSALRDSSGRITSTIALCADISERVEVERALRRQQRLMSDLLSSTKEGFWFIDNEARTFEVNPAMCALLGRTPKEILGRTIFDFVDEANARIFRDEIEARKHGKTGAYELALRRPDGTNVPCLNNASPLFDEEGRKIGSVGLWADITQIKEVQRQIEQAKDEAQAANHAKSAFLATMSHEIRTPLNGVITVFELLADSPATPEQRVQIGLARKAADQLLNIIGNVLDMSKLESGKVKIEAVPFELDTVVDAAVETFAAEADRKGLNLLVDCDPIEFPLVGDPTRLKQITLNLIGNALKFTHEGGVSVRVEVVRDGLAARLRIAVSDTGIGIAANTLPLLMEKFVQGSASTTRNYGGSGLGLAICRQLAEAMGGTLTAKRRRARFHFCPGAQPAGGGSARTDAAGGGPLRGDADQPR
jgi:two-component system sensor histidine kinase/response regulator